MSAVDPSEALPDVLTVPDLPATDRGEGARAARLPFALRGGFVSLATILLVLLAWWLAASLRLVPPLFLPSPEAVLAKLVVVWREGYVDATLPSHLLASVGRVFGALAGAAAIGVPMGLAIGLSPFARGVIDPLLEFVRPIPPLAYLPLVVIWVGIGEASKLLVIGLAMLAPIAISTATGVRAVSRERVNAARALGASGGQVIRHVVLPSALPGILTGLRIALGAGWSTVVAAELIGARAGLGFMIQSASQYLATDIVVMGILVIAAVAFALEATLRWLERRFVPWAGRVGG
ncbi:ABC transporter permease subunit [Aureimonas sp. AU40]|uniref:ABC transporter permease subunit n=1 Tax=Aureimonas sp. AU40 TaxID=1637747 RepID=UPI0007856E7B|nr:ABC transporter permease subunit [Aureimonas sp. AU40]